MMLELIDCYNIAYIGQVGEAMRNLHKIVCGYLISLFMAKVQSVWCCLRHALACHF